ncbi:MAG: EAL domain-containing protein [Gammaproteobacteria bacterium]|nr:EAL domain-containing protein [Gammaproteobacteria bacterium]MDH5304172.1 EAL domain-containing protein [Gammaproteobacteria bacterium]MDH5321569.1 EAL domain-containing protein [Gammaproteobacteria bacterium]
MNGHQGISIAVLTENQDDVALINSSLRDGGHAARCHWVHRPSQLDETLASEHIELLVLNCDRYPDSIRQVVKQKDRYNPELPVIAVLELADESSIEKAMRDGACDLVSFRLKRRLQSVVTRELRALRVERALNSTIHSATEYKKQLKDYMRASPTATALVQEGVITDVNAAWLKLFRAASNDEAAGLPLMDNFNPESHAAIKGALIAAIEGKWQNDEVLVARSQISNDDSDIVHLELTKFVFDDGPCVKVCVSPPAKPSQEPTKLVHDALKRDPTTLFYHRMQFLERVKKRLARKPSSGLHALAYVRIDHFEKVCQNVGILNSDEVLAQFAELVRKRLHPRDVAGRFEGTALMVLLERGSARDAQVWGKQLCEHIRKQTFDVDDRSTQLTCTVGVCAANETFGSLEDFVAAAVAAHRKGKESGGNCSVLSEAGEEDTKQKEFDAIWVRHLRSALMENRFRLAQLPIAGLRSDGIEMYDLLVRMLDEQGNSVLPSEFLPAADRNNMMKNIDRWMIKSAINFCINSTADRVFVRLSRQSILDPTTVNWMDSEFEQCKFDCSRLVMQVPECDAAKHIKQTRVIVKQLRKMGIGFALEHYGIDQEKFQILDILKPDYIKVDGELMHTLITDSNIQSSVGKIVRAAVERNIKTIAERVENANAMAVLFQLGLDFMQGHYVHEPEVVLEDADSGRHAPLANLAAVRVN